MRSLNIKEIKLVNLRTNSEYLFKGLMYSFEAPTCIPDMKSCELLEKDPDKIGRQEKKGDPHRDEMGAYHQ